MELFKNNIRLLAQTFCIPVTTLQKWAIADNRSRHRELLLSALKALEAFTLYNSILSSEEDIEELARVLGFDQAANLIIPGISARTFRSWFDVFDKKKQLLAILIGLHWQLLEASSAKANLKNAQELLTKKVLPKRVTPGEFVKLYQFCPDVLSSLMSD